MNDKINNIKNWLGPGSINLFGRPFCGKDTQGEKLVEALDAVLISGGQILRSTKNPEVLDIISSGKLLPSDMFFDIVLPYFSSSEFDSKTLILDAIGRKDGEAQSIVKAAQESGHELKAVVLIDVSDDEIWKRFEKSQELHDRGDRADDSRSILQTRLEKFKNQTQPVIDYYQSLDLLIAINGNQTVEEVYVEIIDKLHQKAVDKS